MDEKILFTFGAWVVYIKAPGVYRAENTVSGELIEGRKDGGWTLKRFVRMVRERRGWDWAWTMGIWKC